MDGTAEVLAGDPEVVRCVDEFGPLNLQPHPGRQWTLGPAAGRATASAPSDRHRPHGVRHLLAAYDLSRDQL
jgi:hypothetical protein